MRKTKTIRATFLEGAVTVELEVVAGDDLAVYYEEVLIGYVTPFDAQSERSVTGTRLVSRGKRFKAWAQRSADSDRFDYYMQHRSQSAAIRRLLSDAGVRL